MTAGLNPAAASADVRRSFLVIAVDDEHLTVTE